jgi:excisionase family DNA binding protein
MNELSNPLFTLSISEFETLVRGLIQDYINPDGSSKGSERLYSRKEACGILKISLPTLARYIERGVVGAHRVGTRILISQEDINKALRDIPTRRDNK